MVGEHRAASRTPTAVCSRGMLGLLARPLPRTKYQSLPKVLTEEQLSVLVLQFYIAGKVSSDL